MPVVSLDVNDETLDKMVVDCLKETLKDLDSSAVLEDSFERVIAYYSVPGQYKDGMFDEPA